MLQKHSSVMPQKGTTENAHTQQQIKMAISWLNDDGLGDEKHWQATYLIRVACEHPQRKAIAYELGATAPLVRVLRYGGAHPISTIAVEGLSCLVCDDKTARVRCLPYLLLRSVVCSSLGPGHGNACAHTMLALFANGLLPSQMLRAASNACFQFLWASKSSAASFAGSTVQVCLVCRLTFVLLVAYKS